MTTVECFGQRLLNPFRGVTHTVRHGAAEAVTTDGLRWDIYVANVELLRGLDAGHRVGISDIRYGSWSAAQGLKRGALYPSEDFRRMEAQGAEVYRQLMLRQQNAPFPFCDRYELWLLDRSGAPLALLASALNQDELEYDQAPEWRAGFAARESFASAAAAGLQRDGECAGDCLARQMNARAGATPGAQWFRRNPDGGGTGLGGVQMPGGLEGRALPDAGFPQLLLAVDGLEGEQRRLIEDYHDWQAPWLLTLPDLDLKTRVRFERAARRRPFLVERLHRLYPETMDAAEIQAARVEAALRRAASAGECGAGEQVPGALAGQERQYGDDTLSTFYIELNRRGMA